ncbi:MAG: hypothetical protein KY391_02990 [Actinobacteria bacterium]|nr:hypothetical protein [Actinomycetota bacterium]
MKARKIVALLGAAALVLSIFGGTATAKKAKKPLTVGTDAKGDWGHAVDPNLNPVGDALGQDLTGAAISFDGKNVNFVIQLNSLPATGGVPEFSRYTWDMNVNGKFVELDGKFTNYSRGVCDPTSGQCPPPRNPGHAPFFIRGNCAANEANVTICQELGIVEAQFDAGAGTITVPVPAKLIGAKKGSKITPGTNIFGGSISAAPSAYFTSSAMPLDTLTVTKTFVVK